MKTPRWYQLEAVEATIGFLTTYRDALRCPLIGLPTGTGKAFVLAGLIYRLLHLWPGTRILLLSNSAQIIKQNHKELIGCWPSAPIGIHCDKLDARDTMQPIIFGTMQSVWATMKAQGSNAFGVRHIILVDECHLYNSKESTTYPHILDAARSVFPGCRLVGATASPFRMRGGWLIGNGPFTDFAYDKTGPEDFNTFIQQGFLSPLFAKPTEAKIDLEGVSITGGDFNLKELEAASDVERITIAAVREACQLAQDRQSWLAFTAGIQHAEHTCDILNMHGIDSAVVHSKRKTADNDRAIAAHAAGKFRALVNADMLTTGYDCPQIDCILMLRATNSPVLHVQMAGRGTRPAPGKSSCLFLDFARNTDRLGPINDPLVPGPPGARKGQPAPVKICDACGVYNHTSARECMACLAPFEFEVNLKQSASSAQVLTGLQAPKVEIWPIDSAHYTAHKAGSGKTSMQVTYVSGSRMISEYVCLGQDYSGFPMHNARKWWRQRSTSPEAPKSVELALTVTQFLKIPKTITVKFNPGQPRPELIGQEI